MTNAEKFKEVFGIDVDESAPDLCDIADSSICRGTKWCGECSLHNFWTKEYKDNKDETDWYECKCEKCKAKIFARGSQIKRLYDDNGVLHEYMTCGCGNLLDDFKKLERS